MDVLNQPMQERRHKKSNVYNANFIQNGNLNEHIEDIFSWKKENIEIIRLLRFWVCWQNFSHKFVLAFYCLPRIEILTVIKYYYLNIRSEFSNHVLNKANNFEMNIDT